METTYTFEDGERLIGITLVKRVLYNLKERTIENKGSPDNGFSLIINK